MRKKRTWCMCLAIFLCLIIAVSQVVFTYQSNRSAEFNNDVGLASESLLKRLRQNEESLRLNNKEGKLDIIVKTVPTIKWPAGEILRDKKRILNNNRTQGTKLTQSSAAKPQRISQKSYEKAPVLNFPKRIGQAQPPPPKLYGTDIKFWSGLDNFIYKNNTPISGSELNTLTVSLESKIAATDIKDLIKEPVTKTCRQLGIINYHDNCDNSSDAINNTPSTNRNDIQRKNIHNKTCYNTFISKSPTERIKSLVLDKYVSDGVLKAIQSLRNSTKGAFEFMVATAASSSFFDPTQKTLEHFHKWVYPHFSNFSMVVVDLGLDQGQLKLLQKHCRCQVVKFPFDSLPPHVKELKCYTWKPIIVDALLPKSEVLMWADSSTRFYGNRSVAPLLELVKRTRERGVQIRGDDAWIWHRNPFHTAPYVFEAFGDSPCAHMNFRQAEANFIIFHNEPLVRRAVVQPWAACAARRDCMCPPDHAVTLSCSLPMGPHQKQIGFCNRFDQSALSTILSKLFREALYHVAVPTGKVQTQTRGDGNKYLADLDRSVVSAVKSFVEKT